MVENGEIKNIAVENYFSETELDALDEQVSQLIKYSTAENIIVPTSTAFQFLLSMYVLSIPTVVIATILLALQTYFLEGKKENIACIQSGLTQARPIKQNNELLYPVNKNVVCETSFETIVGMLGLALANSKMSH